MCCLPRTQSREGERTQHPPCPSHLSLTCCAVATSSCSFRPCAKARGKRCSSNSSAATRGWRLELAASLAWSQQSRRRVSHPISRVAGQASKAQPADSSSAGSSRTSNTCSTYCLTIPRKCEFAAVPWRLQAPQREPFPCRCTGRTLHRSCSERSSPAACATSIDSFSTPSTAAATCTATCTRTSQVRL